MGTSQNPRGDRGSARGRRDGRSGSGPSKRARAEAGGRSRSQGRHGDPRATRTSRRDQDGRTAAQVLYDGPPIPEEITGRELDRPVLNQLRSLPERLALRVGRHLVAAARLLESDPAAAYAHTQAARARAARVAVVREATGEAAYAAGHFREALAEFKAARRLGGDAIYLPMMADCERALGRPQRALDLSRDPDLAALGPDEQIEMLIVQAGARRDMGQMETALALLETGGLDSRSHPAGVCRLRYAYADTLLAAGRPAEARVWFERAAGADTDGWTDAEERLAELGAAGEG